MRFCHQLPEFPDIPALQRRGRRKCARLLEDGMLRPPPADRVFYHIGRLLKFFRRQLAKRIDAAMLLKVGKRALALPPPVIVSRIRKLMRLVGIDNHQLRIAEPDRHIAIRQ